MHSQFYKVSLDRIRYSLVWEDSHTLYQGLDIRPEDHVLVITSAGCNVLNTLLKKPSRVIAIDLNPVQNQLLAFKVYLIRHYPHKIFRALMGFDGVAGVAKAWAAIAKDLPDKLRDFWGAFFQAHPQGIMTAGKLEAYITGFYTSLDTQTQQDLRTLITFHSLAAQQEFYFNKLDSGPFRIKFTDYFNDAKLSKGRDAKLFAYAEEQGGEAFYKRLVQQVSSRLVQHNFFFRFFFFGPEQLPESILPPCYQKKNYRLLRQQFPTLTVETGEAVDYLVSAKGQQITKASLSNIFEYVSHTEFEKVCKQLLWQPERKLRFMFWNLLQEQGTLADGISPEAFRCWEQLSAEEACFYFRNVRVMESQFYQVHMPAATTIDSAGR